MTNKILAEEYIKTVQEKEAAQERIMQLKEKLHGLYMEGVTEIETPEGTLVLEERTEQVVDARGFINFLKREKQLHLLPLLVTVKTTELKKMIRNGVLPKGAAKQLYPKKTYLNISINI